MNWRSIRLAFAFLSLAILFGCGEPKTSEDKVPKAPPPSEVTPPPPPVPPAPPGPPAPPVNPNIPDVSKTVPIFLEDKVNFTGLQDIAHPEFIAPPLVGDPRVSMDLPNSRERALEGNIFIAVEDTLGLWWLRMNSFPNVSFRDASTFDMIFADDRLVIRAFGTLSGDTLNGTLYYRLRKPNENQCKVVRVVCGPYVFPGDCPAPPDTTAECRSYMTFTSTSVKKLGTFRTKYSQWATVTEDK